jgi:hypothetical protein
MQSKKKEEREHELLSVAIFKQIMENPKVLAEFVDEELSEEHVQLIGEMIRPEEIRRPQTYFEYKRSFLHEVCIKIRINSLMHAYYYDSLIQLSADCCEQEHRHRC